MFLCFLQYFLPRPQAAVKNPHPGSAEAELFFMFNLPEQETTSVCFALSLRKTHAALFAATCSPRHKSGQIN